MKTVLYPGSFDPVTVGHMDIIARAAAQFERVIVGVVHNPQKPSGVFPVAVRMEMLRTAVKAYDNIVVQEFSGLLVDAVHACSADAVVRGLRTSADLETEMQMARLNRQIGGVETFFFAATPEAVHISASFVRDIGRYGGRLEGLVPEVLRSQIAEALRERQ